MKRQKKMLLLLGCLVLLIGLTLAVTTLNKRNAAEDGAQKEDNSVTVFTLDPETVTELSWSYSEDLSFHREGDGWVYTADPRFPLDESFIRTALEKLSEITASRTIENVENWDEYGLQVPVCAISVTAGDTVYELGIGLETGLGGVRYLSTGDGKVYLVNAAVLSPFRYGLYDLLTYEEIPYMGKFTGLTVEAGSERYTIEKDEGSGRAYADSYIWFMGDTTLDTELTETFIGSAADIKWDTCANYYAEDLSEYGLAEPAATVTIRYDEAETDDDGAEVLHPRTFTVHIGDETEEGRYACLDGSRMVYVIGTKLCDTLLNTTRQELLPDEVFTLVWEPVYQLDIIHGGKTYELIETTHMVTDEDGNEEEKTEYLLDGERVAATSIFYVINTLGSDGYATGVAPEGEEVIRFVIYRDHKNFPEVELAFYKYDSTRYLTVLNGEATVFAVREDVDTMVSDLIANVFGG